MIRIEGGIAMSKAVNDATEQKAGDIFQYLIALRDCFDLEEDDTLQIEVNGDVSILTGSRGKFQKEVKHHFGNAYLGDRDIDFWKTLANWYTDFIRIESFGKLILYCTSNIKETSPFYGWNALKKEEKLFRLKHIGTVTKKREKGFREQYTRIFGSEYREENLLKILDKFSIEASRKSIIGVSDEFSKFIGHIPQNNRDSYIGALLGRILILVKDPPHKWEITRALFDKMLEAESAAYIGASQKPLPTEFARLKIPDAEEKTLIDKKFVQAIYEIEYPQMVHDAVSDYWKMDMTVAKYFGDDIMYLSSIEEYKDDLSQKLKYAKEAKKLDKSENNTILLSQRLYVDAMGWDAIDFGSIVNNRSFFQHGVIHDIVEDGDFERKVGDKDEH